MRERRRGGGGQETDVLIVPAGLVGQPCLSINLPHLHLQARRFIDRVRGGGQSTVSAVHMFLEGAPLEGDV